MRSPSTRARSRARSDPSSTATAFPGRRCRATRWCATCASSSSSQGATRCASATSPRSSIRPRCRSSRSPIRRAPASSSRTSSSTWSTRRSCSRSTSTARSRSTRYAATASRPSAARCSRPRGAWCCGAPTAECSCCRTTRACACPRCPAGCGKQATRVSYQAGGITWWADYNLAYADGANANACRLDVGAWVSILNRSGAGYEDAKLKLVAGDVQRAAPPAYAAAALAAPRMALEEKVAGFEQKAFFEYHLYTLGRPTTLPDRSTKQIELFPVARGVPCEKKLVYYGLAPGWRGVAPSPLTDRNYGVQTNKKVDVYLSFENSKQNNMGMPLPAGRVRVSKRDDADGTLEFIGEDVIDHTPKDEPVLIKLGSAFDVVGERRQVAFSVDTSRRVMTEQIEVKLRNHKDQPVTVEVKETLYRWVNWEIVERSHPYRKEDARTVVFPLRVPANGEQVLDYTVRYSW